jgi:hypothetical protein
MEGRRLVAVVLMAVSIVALVHSLSVWDGGLCTAARRRVG